MALSDNLVAYFSLDEPSGNAIDAHGDNDLTDHNAVGSAPGKVNGARDFEATSQQYFSHPDNADLSTGDIDFSLAFWVNVESFNFPAVLSKGGNAQSAGSEYTCHFLDNTTLVFRVRNAADTGFQGVAWPPPFSTGTWYFVVVYHDSVNNLLGISVNAQTPTGQSLASYSGGVFDSSGDFEIGGTSSIGLYMDGLIDEVGFWKRVLSPAERLELYNDGNGRDYAYIVPLPLALAVATVMVYARDDTRARVLARDDSPEGVLARVGAT